MDFEFALRFTEILLAVAFIQQSFEHLFVSVSYGERSLFFLRLVFALILLLGFATSSTYFSLIFISILMLKKFKGPYNGGSDRMGLLILICLCLIQFMPAYKVYVFGYLALQVILSYFLPGFFKAINTQWWKGIVLRDLFQVSAFPIVESHRNLAQNQKLMSIASALVIIFELAFPLVLINQSFLFLGIVLAISFHLANTYLLGFNRFFWTWLAAYPALIWFQHFISTLVFK